MKRLLPLVVMVVTCAVVVPGYGPDIAYAAPSTPTGLALDSADDTGSSSSDGITNKTDELTITGLADPGATVYLKDDGATTIGVGGADGEGDWSVDVTLAPGVHSITAVAELPASTYSDASSPLLMTVDTTAPSLISARISAGNEVTMAYSEAVTYGVLADYSDLLITGELVARSVTDASGGFGTDTNILVFDGDSVLAGGTATIDVNNPPLSVTDLAGNELVLTDDYPVFDGQTAPLDVYVDDDWTGNGNAGGHIWGYDAFDTIQEGLDVVAVGGTVHVQAGEYELVNSLHLNKEGITVVGPGKDDANPATLVRDCSSSGTGLAIESSGITVQGLRIWQTDTALASGNLLCDVPATWPLIRVGDIVNDNVQETVIDGNDIRGGAIGIGLRLNNALTSITGNVIASASRGIVMTSGDYSGTVIEENLIYDNGTGIYFSAGDQSSVVTIGLDNEIASNSEGVYVSGNAHNLVVNGNKIHDNLNATSGLHVENATTGMDASRNWWGAENGPSGVGPGSGDDLYISGSTFVFWRPFCTVEDCSELSTADVELPGEGLTDFFNTGSFVASGSFVGESFDVDSITAEEQVIIHLPDGSTVTIPAGVVITEQDGGHFDAYDLDADEVDETTLTGLGRGVVAEGALQWGIPSLGLQFNPAIELRIFVGLDLVGNELDIRRQGADGNWTQDGIVNPKTCVVDVEGFCEFQATKASTYATTTGGGGGSSGSYLKPTSGMYGLTEGDLIRAAEAGDPDVFIVNGLGFKRLFLNEAIFRFYGHLGGWEAVRGVTAAVRDSFKTSGLFRNCETGEQPVYALQVTGADTGVLHHVNITGEAALAGDSDFFKRVFCINMNEFNWYPKGAAYTSFSQIPVY